MPSRPRPLGLARKRLVRYLPRRTHRRPSEPRAAPDGVTCGMATSFLNRRMKLPVARLVQRGQHGDQLHGWLAQRWAWVGPRMIPLVFAFLGCVGMLNARRYLLELARGPAMMCSPQDAADELAWTRATIVAPHSAAAHHKHPDRCVTP
jgi:hypothetical protein